MAKPTVSANGLSIVHDGNKAKLMATIPDVCFIPGPNGSRIPIPFPNKAESKDLNGGTVTVKIDGGSVAVMGSTVPKSSGDAAGVLGGIVSGATQGKATPIMFSFDVIMEMRPVIRKTDMAIMNDINTVSLSGWDLGDVEGVEGKDWVTFVTIDSFNLKPVSGIKLKITLPDGSEKQFTSAPGGKISVVDIDPGTCGVVLDEGNEESIIKINDDCAVSGLGIKTQHKILIDIIQDRGVSL